MKRKSDKKIKVSLLPFKRVLICEKNSLLKDVLEKTNIKISFPCGGKGICGKCRVKIKGELFSPSEKEKELLSSLLKDGLRLACQTKIKGDIEVEIPISSFTPSLRILTQGEEEKLPIDSFIKKIYFSLPPPSLKDQVSDITRLKKSLSKQGFTSVNFRFDVIKKIPQIIREGKFNITTVLDGKKIIDIEKGDTRGKKFGLAFDIGTTSLVGILLDLTTGEKLATSSILNPQFSLGGDVISRISYIQSNSNGLKLLQSRVVGGINKIIEDITKTTKVKKENIYKACFVGNTVMQHLFLGINPLNLALYPYVPVVQDSVEVKASCLGIKINPLANLYVFPNIAAFVGGDTVGVILATQVYKNKDNEIILAVDIGTNGEIILAKKKHLIAASTAAGPAFEGARISHGMMAQRGAIEKVKLEKGKVIIGTIGGEKPQGICGSGLVDLISELYSEGIITPSGRMAPPEKINKFWRKRLIKKDTITRFTLTEGDSPIYLSQRDIREFQLAKGAIYAGIKILLKEFNVKEEQVSQVLLAGAFGNYINIKNAQKLHLIPDFPNAKVKNIGNAAIMGSMKALLSKKFREEAEEIPNLVDYVEIAAEPEFQNILAEAMFLGEKN